MKNPIETMTDCGEAGCSEGCCGTAECLPSAKSYKINADKTAAVSLAVFWMPIDEDTPRNVKVMAIARHAAGMAQTAELHQNETWYTHWHSLPRFKD